MTAEEIRENLQRVEEQIQRACKRAGRDRREVQLIAVSKTFPVETLVTATKAGITVFGENRVQEAAEKFRAVRSLERSALGHQPSVVSNQKSEMSGQTLAMSNQPSDRTTEPTLFFHLIGHLQSNKARLAAEIFDMIQTVDRLEIAQKLDRQCEHLNRLLPVLIQVNLGHEETKSGVEPEQALELVKQVSSLRNLRVRGLMSLPPFRERAEDSRSDFRALRELAAKIASAHIPNISMNELSMGMSHDFQVAIEEGATWVRIGTAIFGKRN